MNHSILRRRRVDIKSDAQMVFKTTTTTVEGLLTQSTAKAKAGHGSGSDRPLLWTTPISRSHSTCTTHCITRPKSKIRLCCLEIDKGITLPGGGEIPVLGFVTADVECDNDADKGDRFRATPSHFQCQWARAVRLSAGQAIKLFEWNLTAACMPIHAP